MGFKGSVSLNNQNLYVNDDGDWQKHSLGAVTQVLAHRWLQREERDRPVAKSSSICSQDIYECWFIPGQQSRE